MSTQEFICALLGFSLEWCYPYEMPPQSQECKDYIDKFCDFVNGKSPTPPIAGKTALKVTFPRCNAIDIEDTIKELTGKFNPDECQRLRERINEALSAFYSNDKISTFNAICARYKEIWGKDAPLTKAMKIIDEHAQKTTGKTDEQSRPKAPKRKQFPRYKTQISEDRARKIFAALRNGEYISKETSVNDWLYVCNLFDKEPVKPIDWRKGQNELVYFISHLFENNQLWSKTAKIFTIDGKVKTNDQLRRSNFEYSIAESKIVELDKVLEIK